MIAFFKKLFRKKKPVPFRKGAVRVIAHRGLSGLETENTLPAFRRAAGRSYFGIETDVHVTKDGAFVIFHDDDLSRMTQGARKDVLEETPLAVLEEVRLPDKSGKNRPEDLRLPLLTEYLDACRAGGKRCVLELKRTFEEKDVDTLLEVIRASGYLDHLIFISFSRENCTALRRRLPEAPIQFLTSKEIDPEIVGFLSEHRLALDVKHDRLDRALIEDLHAKGIEVNCWTVDDPRRAEDLAAWGVDYITTNILE